MIAPNGSYLRLARLKEHLDSGGCVSIAKLQKYFRVSDGQLEELRDGAFYWGKAGWSIVDLGREFDCVACDMPEVSSCEFPLPKDAADVLYDNGYVVACDIRDGSKWRLTGERHGYRKVK